MRKQTCLFKTRVPTHSKLCVGAHCMQMMPQLREVLFGPNKNRKFRD